jgi:hypothetical protein
MSSPVPLEPILGRHRETVLARGLSALPADRLGALLRQPRLLLDLQELVLVSGGSYWRELAGQSIEHRDAVERGRQRLSTLLAGGKPGVAVVAPAPIPTRTVSQPRPRRSRALRWAASLATAAAVVLGVLLVEQSRLARQAQSDLAASRWGWNRPGALAQDQEPGAYLDRIADTAGEWFNQRPETPIDLARRLGEFRQGCSVLILSPHRPLSAEDRTWLVEKCRDWAAKLDADLAALEGGEDPQRVRDQADTTANNLVRALHERANTISRLKGIS